MITFSVKRTEDDCDGSFSFYLQVFGLPSDCDKLLWEQFVRGGFTYHYANHPPKMFSAEAGIKTNNPSARSFDDWTDDVLAGQKPGPHELDSWRNAACAAPGGKLPFSFAPSSIDSNTYQFYDSPGFELNIGDDQKGKILKRVTWSTEFDHKLWRKGVNTPIFRVKLTLSGTVDEHVDTRRISGERVF